MQCPLKYSNLLILQNDTVPITLYYLVLMEKLNGTLPVESFNITVSCCMDSIFGNICMHFDRALNYWYKATGDSHIMSLSGDDDDDAATQFNDHISPWQCLLKVLSNV